jgi:hypothetical protein
MPLTGITIDVSIGFPLSFLVHLDLNTSVNITTNAESLNTAHVKVYSLQHYVIKFVSDLWQVCGV